MCPGFKISHKTQKGMPTHTLGWSWQPGVHRITSGPEENQRLLNILVLHAGPSELRNRFFYPLATTTLNFTAQPPHPGLFFTCLLYNIQGTPVPYCTCTLRWVKPDGMPACSGIWLFIGFNSHLAPTHHQQHWYWTENCSLLVWNVQAGVYSKLFFILLFSPPLKMAWN